MVHRLSAWFAVICLITAVSQAQEKEKKIHPGGHSLKGEAFNEGPRQRAVLMEGTGRVTFPVTTKSAEAQKFFNQGIGQLHGFWNFEAERSFREVARLDPDCAMAYWGMAMANTVFFAGEPKRAEKFVAEAVKRAKGVSEREALWIESLRTLYEKGLPLKNAERKEYVAALEKLVKDHPDDVEAKAFLALGYWQNALTGVTLDVEKTDALIDEVLKADAMHPSHHYRIHLYEGVDAKKALESAKLNGPAAPAIAHMWHMPAHTYWELERYADATWHLEASARRDHAYLDRARVMPFEIHNYLHNNQWLAVSYGLTGDPEKALRVAMNLMELPLHPSKNPRRDASGSPALGTEVLLRVLYDHEMWDEVLRLSETPYFQRADLASQEMRRRFLVGLAHFHKGDKDKLGAAIADIEKAGEALAKDATTLGEKIYVENAAKHMGKELGAYLDLLNGKKDAAVDVLDKLNVSRLTHLPPKLIDLGEPEMAEAVALAYVEDRKTQPVAVAKAIHVLHRVGKEKEAKELFEVLRKISSHVSLEAPVFKRLLPAAKASGLPADWRLPLDSPRDVLDRRPALKKLGPLEWRPWQAPDFTLPRADDTKMTLGDFREKKKPVLLVFYLGSGCVECVTQLKALVPVAPKFQEAGIETVAIGTDGREKLKEWLDGIRQSDGFEFSFPMLADAGAKIFRQYGAYDDFEGFPLHGVVLVDAKGRVRWHEVSAEPFKDFEFLLEESKRLLGMER